MILIWEYYSPEHGEWFQLFQDYQDAAIRMGGMRFGAGHESPYVVKIGRREWSCRNMCRVLPFGALAEARELLRAFGITLNDVEIAENILSGGLDNHCVGVV